LGNKGISIMKEKTSLDLTHDLFQLMKRFPRPKLNQNSCDELTRSEYELLVVLAMIIADDKKALTATEISSLLQITPAGVTHLINSLEAAGFVERLPDPTDRRVVLIGLTEKGTEEAEGLMADVQEKLIGLVNYLGEENSKTLIHLMSLSIEYFASQLET
jgi:DNA-binding MarR family transcriptional regulator